MNKYEFYSNTYKCFFQVKFNAKGLMVGFEVMNDDGLELARLILVLERCLEENSFLEYMKLRKISVTRIVEDLSFESFWKAWPADGSSKKKARAIWEKMSERDRNAALLYIPVLKGIKAKDGTLMPYSTTYLNGEVYNNRKV